MRVLIVTDWTANEGGIEMYVQRVRDELRAAGDEVRLLTSSAGSAARGSAEYVALGTDNAVAQTGLQLVNPSAVARVRQALREFQPDAVQVNMFEKYLSPAILYAASSVPTVAMAHYTKPICPTALKLLPDGTVCTEPAGAVCLRNRCVGLAEWLRDRPRYRLLRGGLARAARVFACSRWLARELATVGIEAEPIPYPIPPPLQNYRHAPAPEPRFLYVGRFDPEKGVDLLLRAFAQVVACYPAARLRIVGDGRRRPELERLATRLGVGHAVEFVGRLSFAGVEAELASAWALVAPSIWPEPFGLAAAEAIMRKIPVVASAGGGHPETVEPGVGGLLFPNRDQPALAECLDAIASGRAFPDHAVPEKVAERLRTRHDPKEHTDRLRALFDELKHRSLPQEY
jgi:glycosyltransferase involved in cell wall biosynthesis